MCRNCDAPGVEEYCARCGQARRDHRHRISSLIADLLDELSLSGRIFTTLRMLVAHPGALTADWIQGRRAAYISPIRLYVLASVVFFSSAFFLGPPWSDRLPSVGDLGFTFDAAPSALASTVISGRLQTMLTLGVLLLVPLVALLLRVLYARTRFLLVDHLVFSLHLHALTLLALTLLYGLVSLTLTRTPMPDFVDVLLVIAGLAVLAAPVVHLMAALGRVYGRVGWSRTVRAVVMVGAWGVAVGQLANFTFARADAMAGTTLGEIHLVLGRHDYDGMVEARHAGDAAAADRLRDRALRELVFARSAGGRLGAYDLYALAEIRAARGDTPPTGRACSRPACRGA